MQTLPATIRARVDDDAIGRVTRFFNATVTETLNELFQNARRSGASRIDVRIDNGRVSVADDGAGNTDPQALLAFGHSGWDDETRRREDPAGMGVYSLARHDNVTICSQPRPRGGTGPAPRGWRVQLSREHFVGRQAAAVEPINHCSPGTEVSFDSDKALATNVRTAGRYLPLPVYLRHDGKVEEIEREQFLDGAARTEEWNGIRIGVFRGLPGHDEPEINFHGIAIGNTCLAKIEGIDSVWHAKGEVVDCPDLELVLPARKEVVETPFVGQLRAACRAAVYRTMASASHPVDVSVAVREDARALGVELRAARAMLRPWTSTMADVHAWRTDAPTRRDVAEDAIVIDADIEVCDQHTLERATERAGIGRRLYQADRRLEGYEWYDRLIKATCVSTAFTLDGEAHSLETLREDEKPPESCRPEAIMITLHTVTHEGERKGIDLPADVAFGDAEHASSDGERPSLLVTGDSRITPHALADLARDAYFSAYEDAAADSYTRQREE